MIFIHSWGGDLTVNPDVGMSIYDHVRMLLSKVASQQAVPCFFVISEFYFFYHVREFTKEVYFKKVKKRIRTLFVPYLLWNIVAFLFDNWRAIGGAIRRGWWWRIEEMLQNLHGWHFFWDFSSWESIYNIVGVKTVEYGPYLVPMWFLRDLMVMVLLTPVLWFCLKRLGWWFVALLLLVGATGLWSLPGIRPSAVGYFSLGALAAIRGKNLISVFHRMRWVCGPLSVALIITEVYFGRDTYPGSVLHPFTIFTWVVTTFNIATWLVATGRTRDIPMLGKASFFVYALHPMVLGPLSVRLPRLLPDGSWLVMLLRYLITPFLVAALCLLVFVVLRRVAPRCLGVMTGERE